MIYLRSFEFPAADCEFDFRNGVMTMAHTSFYPFGVLSAKRFFRAEFEPLTIFYGENGSGKSTAINIIAEKLGAVRGCDFNKSEFYGDYLKLCYCDTSLETPGRIRVITSDDVFDYMLGIRAVNSGAQQDRTKLFEEYKYIKQRKKDFQYRTTEDFEELVKVNSARRNTMSAFTREQSAPDLREVSNGESAYAFFTDRISGAGLFLLDEPENSLSPANQRRLAGFLEESVRFFGCQLIISTHSPFLLAMRGAKIYDLDDVPVRTKKYGQLESMRTYSEFFKHLDIDGKF